MAAVPHASPSGPNAVPPPQAGQSGTIDAEQINRLLEGAINVSQQLARGQATNRKRVVIHESEAQYLQLVPFQLLHDITELAIRRVQMRGKGANHMQRADIDWALGRLVVGKRQSGWPTALNSVGGILLGAGAPVLIGPLVNGQQVGASAIILALALGFPGLAALSVSLTMSIFRR